MHDLKELNFSKHAGKRMVSRNISRDKIEQILSCGKIFSCGNGHHKAKFLESVGKNFIRYEVIFDKRSMTVITLWTRFIPADQRSGEEDNGEFRKKLHNYKFRKRFLAEKDLAEFHEEEMRRFNFSA
jgi:hypothetical protein